MRNVVITGIGLLTPVGQSFTALFDSLSAARPAIGRLAGGPAHRVGAVVTADIDSRFDRQQRALFDRTSQLAMIAGDAAMLDAGLARAGVDAARAGVFVGCGSGPSHAVTESYRSLYASDSLKALTLLRCLPNAPAAHLAMDWQLKGACQTFAAACASSALAIGEAMRAIRHGYLDMALAGGVEAPFGEGIFRAWEALRVLAPADATAEERSCKPFSKDRNGIVLGEGAAFFVLEVEEHARARGARRYANLAGYGTSADALHLTTPCPDGQAAAMRLALADAGRDARDLGYLHAPGTAPRVGDAVETRSIRQVVGTQADAIPVSSTKSLHGHLLGASAALELAAAIVALRHGLIPPTANLDAADDDCDLDFVPNTPRHGARVKAALSNSFAFGGTNACLVVN